MKIGIIGGGASGTIAAIFAKLNGHDVTILERKDRILKKVLTTGNGRCNFTNIYANYDNYYSIEEKIDNYLFNEYSYNDVIKFFEGIGIYHIVEKKGKVYPMSLQASSIVDALRFKLENLNIEIKLEFDVKIINKVDNKFLIISTNNEKIYFDKIVIASGGKSYPELGSNGSMYEILKNLGHSITKTYPILVQLKTDKEYIKGLEGVKQEVLLKVFNKNNFIREDLNELLFTPYGISGPSVFNLSYLTALYNINDLKFIIDFLPSISKNKLKESLFNRKYQLYYLNVEYFLNGIVNKKLAIFLLKKSGLEKLDIKVENLDYKIINKLVDLLKNYEIKVYDTTGFSNAQVTAGGVKIKEINNKTLESKIIPNMYLIGECLDIFGDCGGYNLNWCFISGIHVGKNI